MEHRHLGALRGSCHRGLRPVPVGHQTVIQEVPEVPVLAEGPGPEVLEVMDMEVAAEVVIGEVRGELEEVLLLADLVGLLLVE